MFSGALGQEVKNDVAEARTAINEQYISLGKARRSYDRQTIEKMLAEDFYFQLPDRRVSRQEFAERISQPRAGVSLRRFEAIVLTVESSGSGWVAVVVEKAEFDITSPEKVPKTNYVIGVSKDLWERVGGRWVARSSEAISNEAWRGGPKPPFKDW